MITDLPCIISGDVFAVLDPHKININCKDDEGVPLTGTEISVADLCSSSSLSSCYNGLFGFEMPLDNDYYDGTIFRFPLRSPQANSKLSETTYSSEKVLQNLFYSLSEEASMLLLFLKNITNISLYNYNMKICRPKLLLDISIDSNRVSQVQAERRRCIELAKEWQRRQNSVIRLYSLLINVKDVFNDKPLTTKSFYLVLNSIGSSDTRINVRAKQLQVIPWVGIAAPCSFSTVVKNCEVSVSGTEIIDVEGSSVKLSEVDWEYIDPVVSGHAFCFLPLPNLTGLPVSINGYFSIADNRRSIKWPTHDERGKGADFNKELVMKMVSYAYAMMITCRCQLVSYVNTPSYLSTELSDAYSIWPLISQVKNHPIWSYLVEPVMRLLTEQKVVWTAAEGGKWVNFNDAYYQPEDLSTPNAVIDLLLEIGKSFVVLPKVAFESIKITQNLATIVTSRIVTPDLVRRLLKKIKHIPSIMLHQAKCIDILSFILSDFDDCSKINCLLGMNIIPLIDKISSPKQLSKERGSEMLYILQSDDYISFLLGINNHIIANNLPDEVTIKLTQLSRTPNVNIKLADDEIVCKELLPLSLQQWQISLNDDQFSWYPNEGNHPPLKWIFKLWKWLSNVDLNSVWNLAIVPQEKLDSSKDKVEVINLLPLSKCYMASVTLSADASKMDNKVAGLLKALGVIIIIKSSAVFQNSGLYEYLLDLTPSNVISLLTDSRKKFKLNSIKRWRADDKQLLFKYLSSATLNTDSKVELVKDLPIFRVGVSKQEYATLHDRQYFIAQNLFGLRIDVANVVYPDNVFYCTNEETDFLYALHCAELTFYDYCVNYFLPNCDKQNTRQKKKNYQWVLSCEHLWCDDLTKYLRKIPLVATASAQKMVKPSKLYDPKEPVISQLFDNSEDELPLREYQQFLPQLRKLGLITWNMIVENGKIYEQLLLNRICSVKTLLLRNSKELAMKRSFIVVTYLVDYFTKYDPSYDFESNVKSQKFLFCAGKPTPGYPVGLQWVGLNESKYTLFSPNGLYCRENSLLVGGTGKILSERYSMFTSCEEFCNLFKVPDMMSVINQLNLLIDSEPTSTFPTSVYAIYDYFNDNLDEFKVHCDRLNSSWIWVDNKKCFVDVSKFAMYPFCGKQLEPFCYAIAQTPQLLKYERIFSSYGVPDDFPEDIMLNVLFRFQSKSKLSSSYLDTVISILDWVHETNKESEELPDNILLPTDDYQLLPPEKCIFDDRGWSRGCHKHTRLVSNYSFTHRRLPLDTATFFKVKLLSQHLLPSINLKYNLAGPHQSITRRIKEALEDYDQDIDVFKEMIQNAEDAGASQIKFVIDWRNHPTEYLLTREMEAWQGPALLVYNNAVFSDDDFTNICEIAGASKKIDPTKIGRFGIGFCSVYHITDVPSFISRNFYTLFDPNLLYMQERVTSTNPGIQIDFKSSTAENLKEFKDQFTPFCGLFHCDVFSKTKHFNGTLFRLPFRTKQIAQKSKISQEIYGKERIDKVAKMVREKASEMLMFLSKINSISLYELKQQGPMECLLHVEREQKQPKDLAPLVQLFKSNFSKNLTTQYQVRKFFIRSVRSKDNWMVISCLGSGRSLEIAQSSVGRQKGLCPFGEIAIKLDPILLSPCKSMGSLFCFMPVPIKSSYCFFINGYFDVSRDRRSLKKDSYGNLTEWNSALIKDAISKCFLQMLFNLDLTKAMKVNASKCLEAYYSIWPHKVDKKGNDYNQILYNSIKELLLETDANLLWSYNKWVCPKTCYVYLNLLPKLPDDRKNEIISLLLDYGYAMVDIPPHVKDLVSPKIVTYEMFCTDVLFPHLEEIENDTRNNQIIQLLKQCTDRNGWQFNLLTTKECIATKPIGTLKKPKDLVDPKCSLAGLYSEEDECFPSSKFCGLATLNFLRNCDMTFLYLSTEQLKERAYTINSLPNDKAYDRSQKLIKYITLNYATCKSSNIANELKDIQFLPVIKCPKEVRLPWFGATIFETPNKIYPKQYQNLLFTQVSLYVSFDNILEILCQNKIPTFSQVLGQFRQLISYWQNNKINNEPTNKLIGESCQEIYEYLQNNAIVKYKQLDKELQQLQDEICNLPFVWQNDIFLPADNVVLKWDYAPYSDLLCDLSKDANNKRFKDLFKLLGINESPTESQCMSILDKLHTRMNDSPLLSDAIEFCLSIAKYLVNKLSIGDTIRKNQGSGHDLLQKLYLPDETGIMRHYKNLAYRESIEHSSLKRSNLLKLHFKEGTYWLHKSFDGDTARHLGIPSALVSILDKITDKRFLHGSDYGQHEDLCDRINSLLDKYPKDVTIFKEFIQNAEDAGASEIAFIIDEREFTANDGELFSDSKNWYGLHKLPSLLVYNNKTMTEDDLIGITKLGRGNKHSSLESIGRFGVGFNVAYHITDCPMYLSYGPGGVPENFCVLDPTCEYAPHATITSPGERWKLNDQAYVEQFYKQLLPLDIKKFQEFKKFSDECMVELSKNENGCVVFRLPLTKLGTQTLNPSKISPKSTIDIYKLKTFLKCLGKDASKIPLFIKNLKHISAFEINKHGVCSHYFTTTVSMNKDSAIWKSEFSKNIKLISMQRKESKFLPFHALYTKSIKTTMAPKCIDTRMTKNVIVEEEWLLSEQFGSPEMPEEVVQAGFSASLTPLGGVAILLQTTNKFKHLQEYNLFCSLPLPLKSYLPLHVNGHFWVDDSRKHLETGAVGTPLSKWNECLTTTVISSVYLEAIKEYRKHIDLSNKSNIRWYYSLFPSNCLNEDSKLHSYGLPKYMYASMIVHNSAVLQKQVLDISSKKKVEWISTKQACFLSDKYEKDDALCSVILAFKLNLTNAPIQIYHHIESSKLDCPSLITPEYLILFLKSTKDIHDFEELIKSNIKILLDYCLLVSKEYDDKIAIDSKEKKLSSNNEKLSNKDKDVDKRPSKNTIMIKLFSDVPLLLTHDGYLRKFNLDKPVYSHNYAKFFPHRSQDFIHPMLEECKLDLLKDSGFIKELTIKYLAQHTTVPNTTEPILSCDVPDVESFWTCLHHITQNMSFGEIKPNELSAMFRNNPIVLGNDNKLYPLCKAKMVLRKFESHIVPAYNIMIRLGYPVLNTDHKVALTCVPLFASLVASPQKGDDVVECIHLHQKTFLNFSSTWLFGIEEDLRRFINIISSSSLINHFKYDCNGCINSVCKLPIFKTFDKNFEPLSQHRILLPNEYKMIPTGGLEAVAHNSSKQILIPEGIYSQIYRYLDLNSPSLVDFYIKFIFKHIIYMDKEDIFQHIDLLRKEDCIAEKALVSVALWNIPFMEHKTVSEYYDPEIEVFKTFLPSDAFPPTPWNDEIWLPVLRILGLQNLVTGRKLIEFAKSVENASYMQRGITHNIRKAEILLRAISERMCNKKHPEPLNFCEELSNINFIPTYKDTKCDLKSLLKVFTNKNIDEYFECKFIPFKGAIIPHHQGINYHQISFTANTVIDWSLEKLQCSKPDQDAIAKRLHMCVQPSCATVVNNLLVLSKLVTSSSIQNVCNFRRRDKYVDELENLFNAHYKFLEDGKYDITDLSKLQNESFIFVRKEESKIFSMVQSAKVVKFMTIQQDLSPYLFKMPTYFSRYIDLIKHFNIQEQPTSLHFAETLKEIYFHFFESNFLLKESHLCLNQAETAYAQLLELLREEDISPCQKEYYLLGEDDNLHPQSKLVYNDAPWYRNRLENGYFNFLKQPMQGNFSLPKCLQVSLLSSLVSEEISDCTFIEDNECMQERLARQSPSQSNGCEYVLSLKLIIKSPQFKTGLRRIIHHQTGRAPSQKDEDTINRLDSLEFKCYHSIETVLKDVVLKLQIPTSLEKDMFCVIHDDSKMYIAPHTPNANLDEVVSAISLKVNNYLGNIISNDHHVVQMVKSIKPEDIKMRLDQLQIQQYDEQRHSFKRIGDLIKKEPDQSDRVVFENFYIKEEVIYWNAENHGIFATIHSINSAKDVNDGIFDNSITLTVNDGKDTEVTTLFCISKLLHPSQMQSINLHIDGQQTEQIIISDLLLYDIPHECEDEAIAWITGVVEYCDTLTPQQHYFVLERLKFYAYYYLVICNQAQHIYDTISNILDSAIYNIKSLLQNLNDSLQCDDYGISQPLATGPFCNAFSQSRSSFIRPRGTTCGYYLGPSGRYHLNPPVGALLSTWGPPIVVEEKPQVNLQEAYIWYHQASADRKACEYLIETTPTSNMPGGFKCQHCALVCFLSHEIVDLCLKALCYAFVGLSNDVKRANNILMFYKQLTRSSNCPSLNIEQYIHQVSEYDRSTRFPDAHVPSEPPCCVYDETDAYNAFIAAQKVFECARQKLSSADSQTFPLIKRGIIYE